MKTIKVKVKQWLAKKLRKQLLPYVMLDLTNDELEFLIDCFYPNRKK